jgi:peptidoglycan/xylan/chitin deacetylase (PgdA/CDA1 family)
MRVERTILARRAPVAAPHGGRSRILCYHAVGTPMWGVNDVTPARFRRHMELAIELGYRFVSARDVAARDVAGDPGGERRLAVTFDDGLRSVATGALPTLLELGIPATVFVVSGWAAGDHDLRPSPVLDWGEVRALADAGVTIGSHSVSHPDFATLDEAGMRRQLEGSRAAISAATGLDTDEFAVPFGQSGNWPARAGELAAEAGYRHVYAQSERRRPPGTTARTFVSRYDDDRIFTAVLAGAMDGWEEWV